jgi:hypothetical protein
MIKMQQLSGQAQSPCYQMDSACKSNRHNGKLYTRACLPQDFV